MRARSITASLDDEGAGCQQPARAKRTPGAAGSPPAAATRDRWAQDGRVASVAEGGRRSAAAAGGWTPQAGVGGAGGTGGVGEEADGRERVTEVSWEGVTVTATARETHVTRAQLLEEPISIFFSFADY